MKRLPFKSWLKLLWPRSLRQIAPFLSLVALATTWSHAADSSAAVHGSTFSESALPATLLAGEKRLVPGEWVKLEGRVDTSRSGGTRVFERIRLPMTMQGNVVRFGTPSSAPGARYGIASLAAPSNAIAFDAIALRFSALDGQSCTFFSEVQLRPQPVEAGEVSGDPAVTKLLGVFGAERKVFHDLRSARIVAANSGYLLERESGIHRTTDWQFAKDGSRSVYKRLVDVDLVGAQYIEFDVDPRIDRLNLRFSRRVGGRPTDVIGWDQLPATRMNGSNRADRIRIDVRALRDQQWRSIEVGQPLKLVEIIAFSRADEIVADGDKPVGWMTVGYAQPGSTQRSSTLVVSRIQSEQWELHIPLAEVRQSQLLSASLVGGEVRVDDRSCGARFHSAELVSYTPDVLPAWVVTSQRQLRAWGGAFSPPLQGTQGVVEWPVAIATLPLRELAPLVSHATVSGASDSLALRNLIAGLGVSVNDGSVSRLALTRKALELQGQESAELTWRIQTPLPRDTYFVAVGEGHSQQYLPAALLTFRFADGTVSSAHVPLGKAVDLRVHAGRVLKSVAVRLGRRHNAESLSLTELALFSVQKIPPARGVELPQAGWYWVGNQAVDLSANRLSRLEAISVALTPGVTKAGLAAVRVDYRLTTRPRRSCWLEVDLEGGQHTATARVCPVGGSGTSVISSAAKAFDAFPNDAKIDRITWRIAEGALPPGATANLQTHHAFMSGPSVADLASRELAVEINGATYEPRMTPAAWDRLLKGPAWVDYPSVTVSEGRFHVALSNSLGGAFRVKEWRLSGRDPAVLPERLSVHRESQAAALVGRVGNRGIAVVGIVIALGGLLLWVRSWRMVRDGVLSPWRRRTLAFVTRGVDAMAARLQVALSEHREGLNLVAPTLAWCGLGLSVSGGWESAEQSVLIGAVLLTTFSSISNALRWRADTTRWEAFGRSAWIAGSSRLPPFGVWFLACLVAFWVALAPPLRELTRTELFTLFAHVGAADVLLYFLPLTLLRLASSVAEPEFWLLWMALGASLLPWAAHPLALVARAPNWRWVRLLLVWGSVLLLLEALGFRTPETLGHVVPVLLVWPTLLALLKRSLAVRYPSLANRVFGNLSSIYVCGGMAGTTVTAALLAGGMSAYAAALANVVMAFWLCALACLVWKLASGWSSRFAAQALPMSHR